MGMKFPWDAETLPAAVERPLDDTIRALQHDFAYAVAHTAVVVHSKHEALQLLVNTPRGQVIPRGECKLTDGSTIEFQDIGMPQVGARLLSVKELLGEVWGIVAGLGLGVKP